MLQRKIAFTCKLLTPLFMHGADNRSVAELRPPSFKGLMRYWFRALGGGIAGLNDVRAFEDQVFGSTEIGQGITVRVEEARSVEQDRLLLLPHKPKPKSTAIKAEAEFTLVLCDRPGRNQKFLEAAAWAFWLAANLGGFGQRARRGAGNLLLTKVEPAIDGMQANNGFCSADLLKTYLEGGIRTAQSVFRNFLAGHAVGCFSTLPTYPILSAETAKIQIVELQDSDEEQARATIMKRIAPFKNLVWGLPYGSPAKGETRNLKKAARMASPVWFHLARKTDNGFFLVQTLMKSTFPAGLPSEPDWTKIEKYFQACTEKNKAVDIAIPPND